MTKKNAHHLPGSPRALVAFAGVFALAILIVVGLVLWDEGREEDAAFEELTAVQTEVATAVELALEARLSASPTPLDIDRLSADLGQVERRPDSLILLLGPDSNLFYSVDGRSLDAPELRQALEKNLSSARLSRDQASALGLPHRTAIAGFRRVKTPAGEIGLAAISSVNRERAREFRSRVRVVVSTALVAGSMILFGSLVLRRIQKDKDLERELSLAELRERSDERLARAGKVAMLGTLATGVAHEIATPLGVIVGRAEQLEKRAAEDPRMARSVKAILEQTDRINSIVRGFLGVARGGQPELESASAAAVVESAVRLTSHRFEKASVELSRGEEAAGTVRCDRRLFEHALVNLLLNACEACEAGGHVRIEIRASEERVTFEVTDDGSGIRGEDAARAVEPFFTTKPAGQGTGLGLAITSEIVKIHRGTLSLSPARPRGTTAVIDVPRAQERDTHDQS